jgi:ketosteroid isomerase-like protein
MTAATSNPTQSPSAAAFLNEVKIFFSQLQAADLKRLGQIYAPNARFKDPFNEVQGVLEIERIFAHMFATLVEPRFVIKSQALEGSEAFITWNFVFRSSSKAAQNFCIRGASHLQLAQNPQGQWQISDHRDYWDAAEELYAKLPLLGALMRWLARRLSSQHHPLHR